MAIRIDLPELGDGQYVEMKDPKFLSWGIQKEITSKVAGGSNEAQLDVAEILTIALVKSGNVLNEDGVPFNFPITADNVKDIPSIVIQKVTEKFAEMKKVDTDRKNL